MKKDNLEDLKEFQNDMDRKIIRATEQQKQEAALIAIDFAYWLFMKEQIGFGFALLNKMNRVFKKYDA